MSVVPDKWCSWRCEFWGVILKHLVLCLAGIRISRSPVDTEYKEMYWLARKTVAENGEREGVREKERRPAVLYNRWKQEKPWKQLLKLFALFQTLNISSMASGPYNYSYIFKYIIIGDMVSCGSRSHWISKSNSWAVIAVCSAYTPLGGFTRLDGYFAKTTRLLSAFLSKYPPKSYKRSRRRQ